MRILITTVTEWEVDDGCSHHSCTQLGTHMIAGGNPTRGYRGQVPFKVCDLHVSEYLDTKLYVRVEEITKPMFGYIKI